MNSDSSELDRLFDLQREAYTRNRMPTAEERIGHLLNLERALINYQDHLAMALNADFGCRSGDESRLAEIFPSVEGIRYAAKRVKRWMRPSRRHVGLLFKPARARVLYQPLGVVGIITPWNYPVYLSIGPLTSALAAGNRVVIKMSKFTPHTAEALRTVLAKTFDEDHVTVLEGAPGLVLPRECDGARSAWHLYTIRVAERDRLQSHLKERGIASAVHYPRPIHLQPSMAEGGGQEGDLPVSEEICREVLCLPMYSELGDRDIERIADGIRAFLD